MADLTPTDALAWRIVRYRDATADRNPLVRELRARGWLPRRIADELEISKTTVYRILGARYKYDHGRARHTRPRNPHPEV